MTRTFTFIIGIAVAALALAPAALGEGRLAPLQPPSNVATYRDAGERGSAGQPSAFQSPTNVATYRDAGERGSAARPSAYDLAVAAGRLDLSTFRNAFDRSGPTSDATNLTSYRDAAERAVPIAAPAEIPVVTSRREIEWPQVGIGVSLGLALALGLWLAMRATRIRPVAH